jgi:predicted transcriptional regulator
MSGRPIDPQFARNILDHLRAHPVGLSAYEIMRALSLADISRVRNELARLAALDLVKPVTGPKDEYDLRPVARWWPA